MVVGCLKVRVDMSLLLMLVMDSLLVERVDVEGVLPLIARKLFGIVDFERAVAFIV